MLGETEDGSRSPAISNLYLALGVMTVQQTFATMGRSTVPLIAAAIVTDLDVDPALVGIYLAIGSVAAFLTTMGCGGFILRYGALRMTQVGMLALGVGLAVVVSGWLILFAVGAFIGGWGRRFRRRPVRICWAGSRRSTWRRSSFRSSRPAFRWD